MLPGCEHRRQSASSHLLEEENIRLQDELLKTRRELEDSRHQQRLLELELLKKTEELSIALDLGKARQRPSVRPLHSSSHLNTSGLENQSRPYLFSENEPCASPLRSAEPKRHGSLSDEHESGLFGAVKEGDLLLVKSLIVSGKVSVNETEDETGSTPLIDGAKIGHVEVTKFLLDNGAEVDHPDNAGSTALIYAAKHGHVTIVSMLLEKGADINHRNIYAINPLIYAAKYGRVDVVKLLLQRGADANQINVYGSSALIAAAFHGHCEIVSLLIQAGANVNQKDRSGWSALVSAIQRNYLDIVLKLLEAGAEPDNKAESGWTPLFFAIKSGENVAIAKALLKAGSNVNVQTTDRFCYYNEEEKRSVEFAAGWTPLMVAASLGKVDFVKLLLEHGAEKNVTSADGQDACSVANQENVKKILQGN